MTISASARHHLFRKLEDVLGPEDAGTLMDSLPAGGWENVATKDDLRHEIRTLGAQLRQEMAEMENRLASKADLHKVEQAIVDLEHRMIDHIDMRIDVRMAASQRSTIAWVTAMNATMISAVIAAIRL